jgi:zinc protease
VNTITREDLETYRRSVLARDNVTISVVGDIDEAGLASLLDKLFGELPAHAQLKPLPQATSAAPQRQTIEMDLKQAKVAFGYLLDPAFTKKDMAAIEILNQILNGGLLISRLDTEVRVKRGLVYSIGCSIYVWQHGAGVLGQFGADRGSVDEALALTQLELQKLADEGPTDEEIRDAKSSLQDSFLVSLNTNAQLAGHMQWLQQFGFGIDRLDTYASEIEAITTEDLRRVAKRVFNTGSLTIAMVGKSS